MAMIMRILNMTPDSFWEEGRGDLSILESGADIIDIGAVSTRPGAPEVSLEEEWRRLEPALDRVVRLRPVSSGNRPVISIDTYRAEIVRRASEKIGDFIVNDISAGEDDPEMLSLAGSLGLPFIAMHKRGNPRTMDSQCDYSSFASVPGSSGVMEALLEYFTEFEQKAASCGIENWILDPGLGFAKTPEQCWEILRRQEELLVFNRPVLIAHADKRFTRTVEDGNALALGLALAHGAAIVRIHR